MPFTQETFTPLASQANSNSPKLWTYRSPDPINTIIALDYFADKRNQLTEGDFIIIEAVDSKTLGIFIGDADAGFTIELYGGNSGISDAPAGLLSVRTAGEWKNSTEISGQPIYNFDTDTTPSNPGQGFVRFDNTDYSLITEVYAHKLTEKGTDISSLFDRSVPGDFGVISNYIDAKQGLIFKLLQRPVDNGDWYTLYVEVLVPGSPIDDNADISVFPFQTGIRFLRDGVSATNTLAKSTTSFFLGGDALQKNFIVDAAGTYELGVIYQWSQDRKNSLHRARVRIDGVENTDLRCYQYMGGTNFNSSVRMTTHAFTEVELTVGTYDIDFQFSTDQIGRTAYTYYRRLYLRKVSND